MDWEIRIIEKGRYGYIQYIEGNYVLECYWEFGGGKTIAIINLPTPTEWTLKYRWGKNRRQEIVTRIAEETRRLRAPDAVIEWDEPRNCFYLREPHT